MDFDLPEEARALQQMCRDFTEREIRPYAAQWSETEHVPTGTYRKMGELGLMGMLVAERYGGSDAGFVTYVAAMEEIGRGDQSLASGWNAHSTIASLPLATFGTEEQKRRWLAPLASGTHLGAFGLTEPTAGSDARGIRTRATRADGGWLINGTKMFITNAGTDMSLGVTLLAVTGDGADGKRFGTFFVPDATAGYEKGRRLRKLGWHACDTRELVFTDCWVPDDHLIGDDGNGLKQFMQVLDPGRISVAALALSLASAALEMAVRHAGEREQFGRKVGDFQAVGHKLADMATEVEAARALVYRAAWLADSGRPYAQAAAMAKLYASEAANRCARDAVQIHGGYGYIRESEISRFYADAKILEIGEGTNEVQRNVIARTLGRQAAGRT
ncbi:acyl-CoA dehydrogenase family protein [Pseudonocardia parietis]|uniref:Alkylation response protein AidB-like acyl-CoA dehydrogenase n=1 Tax=Pseudonocardia parietis TaxID=570936 RepID=A0ABS4VVU9_9PSEU|nr:acyl-CoA dehydrogenase family protein [Pseudonocardia parietis]MBP2368042.1 alkylation response protein AidB-like acyl-CoA dehydrogenase [Pseudonocardia parietis]